MEWVTEHAVRTYTTPDMGVDPCMPHGKQKSKSKERKGKSFATVCPQQWREINPYGLTSVGVLGSGRGAQASSFALAPP